MNIAIIQDNIVKNIIVCESVEFAQQLLPDVICADADVLTIGEKYDKDIPDPEVLPDPDTDRDTMLLDHEYRLTLLELGVT